MFDLSHIIVIAFNRCVCIAVKYGFYSDKHYFLKRNVAFDTKFLAYDLIATIIFAFDSKWL